MSNSGFQDAARLADALALAQSFKKGGKHSEFQQRTPSAPAPKRQTPAPMKAWPQKKAMKMPAQESRFASRNLIDNVWPVRSGVPNVIGSAGMDFLMRKENTAPVVNNEKNIPVVKHAAPEMKAFQADTNAFSITAQPKGPAPNAIEIAQAPIAKPAPAHFGLPRLDASSVPIAAEPKDFASTGAMPHFNPAPVPDILDVYNALMALHQKDETDSFDSVVDRFSKMEISENSKPDVPKEDEASVAPILAGQLMRPTLCTCKPQAVPKKGLSSSRFASPKANEAYNAGKFTYSPTVLKHEPTCPLSAREEDTPCQKRQTLRPEAIPFVPEYGN